MPATVGMACSVSWRPKPHPAPSMHWLKAMRTPLGSRSSASRSGDHWLSRHPNPGKKELASTVEDDRHSDRHAQIRGRDVERMGPPATVGHDAGDVRVLRERGLQRLPLRLGGECEHVDQARSPIRVLPGRPEILGRRLQGRLYPRRRPGWSNLERQGDRAGGERRRTEDESQRHRGSMTV